MPGLVKALLQAKELLFLAGSRRAYGLAQLVGLKEKERWGVEFYLEISHSVKLSKEPQECIFLRHTIGQINLAVSQECAMIGLGKQRIALSRSDLERLHQLIMSATSALIGAVCQLVVGTPKQRARASSSRSGEQEHREDHGERTYDA